MKWNSIRTKVLVALIACLVLAVGGILALMHYSFERNAHVLALPSSVNGAPGFSILEARESSKMTAVSDTPVLKPAGARCLRGDGSRSTRQTNGAPLYKS